MASKILMPAGGQNTDESTIVGWLVEEGAIVERGDVLFEIETDKAIMAVESYAKGVLLKRCYEEGDSVAAGNVVAYVGEPGEKWEEDTSASAAVSALPVEDNDDYAPIYGMAPEQEEVLTTVQETDFSKRVKASPKARKAALDKNVDLSTLSKRLGRVVKYTDVIAEASQIALASITSSEEEEYTLEIPSTMRRAIARRMKESQMISASFHVSIKVDMTAFLQLRTNINETLRDSGVKISINDMLIKCIATAVEQVPYINAYYTDDEIRLNKSVNVGLAVALDAGLIVPVVKGAESLSLKEIAYRSAHLVAQAKSGGIRESDISGGTITLSNMGMYGVDSFTAIINQPESAILAVSAVKDTVVPVNGEVVVRPIMDITATFDHRIIDGSVGAKFMGELKKAIELPLLLLL